MFDYAPAPEAKLASFQKSYGHFIGGKFTKPANLYPTINPATEEVLAQISHGTAKDVDLAVKAARSSYEKVWSKLSGAERGKYLYRIARIMQERARELAVAETLNNGKPIKETRDFDVPTAVSWFFYYAGWADKLDHAGLGPNPQALGVAAQVVPWNFPLMMLAWKIAPALAAGNTIVLKPSETTPLSALLFAEICQQAELPEGVVNIVTGFGDTGAALVGHTDVNKVAFTGSTEVGKIIAKQVAGSNKKVTIELGGKAANIVVDDAPIDQAIEGVINGIFFNQGHALLAGIAFLIEGAIMDWGALLMIERAVFSMEQAALGYIAFSITMVIGRLSGDFVVPRIGRRAILLGGGTLVVLGLIAITTLPSPALNLIGFAVVGLGAANLVPVVFAAAGQQSDMDPNMAVASVTFVGYAGILLGPAIIGFGAQYTSLPLAMASLALLGAVYLISPVHKGNS